MIIPEPAQAKLRQLQNAFQVQLNETISNIAAGMGLEGKLNFDDKTMEITPIEVKKEPDGGNDQ